MQICGFAAKKREREREREMEVDDRSVPRADLPIRPEIRRAE